MSHRLRWLFTSLILAGALLGALFSLPRGAFGQTPTGRPAGDAKLDAALQAAVATAAPDDALRFILHFAATADLAAASLPEATVARRTAVVARLQSTAAASQAPARQALDRLVTAGGVSSYRPFWIINAVAVQGTAAALQQLALQPEVVRITLDEAQRYFDDPLETAILTATQQAADGLPWGIDRVRAPHVWHGLGINGRGVTVAIMDTGVDWQHPALRANYRGNQGGAVNHASNWYHTAVPTITEPFDEHGHGTHVAGTAVGQGIGVAPGAQWIAVAIADKYGVIYDSNVHAGFEWLMAPSGDPALAPDVINNSWTGAGARTEFLEDVRALQAANIIPVFAAGNNGPHANTVGSPASYPGVIAVGASDARDAVAWFSSRGPSPLTRETKPLLVAPGAATRSARTGGGYTLLSGTSMATPHVVGAIALLRSASPDLSEAEVVRALRETAMPLAPEHPNRDSGYGRLDAYAAVARYAAHGELHGRVLSQGQPVAGAVLTITTPAGVALPLRSAADGTFRAPLQAGSYRLAAAAYGYAPWQRDDVWVAPERAAPLDVVLEPLPGGVVTGIVQGGPDAPLRATVRAEGTPLTTTTGVDGRYRLALPAGAYELVVSSVSRRLGRQQVRVQPGSTQQVDWQLAPAPHVLLVDSGQWRYSSAGRFYRDALEANDVAFAEWPVYDPFNDLPEAADLYPYDVVVWSAPNDSPGVLGVNEVITDYLGTGGRLLISGEDVGRLDGHDANRETWWWRDLAGVYQGETVIAERPVTVTGAAGTPFAGLTLTLNGGSSANNQVDPDRAEPRRGSSTDVAWRYGDGEAAGLLAGFCRPFRIVYLGFGLEGVSAASDRAAVMDGSLRALLAPREARGVDWLPSRIDDFGLSGTQQVYMLTVRNRSETLTDTFRITVHGDGWQTELLTQTVTLGPCERGQVALRVAVPDSFATEHAVQVTAVSTRDATTQATLSLTHRRPQQVLLVDDDRFFDREEVYQAALDDLGLSYDTWETRSRGSPPARLLRAYDYVVWFTGYDWYSPVTAEERAALAAYLAGGGRLFLSSQDFLANSRGDALAQTYLGIIGYHESITPTQAFASPELALPDELAGPLPLAFEPYQNYGDSLIPVPAARPFLWHDQGVAGAAYASVGGGRAVFWAMPFETLPPAARTAAMNSIIGWLSALGESTFQVDQRVGAAEELRTFTITLRNEADAPRNQTTLINAVPPGLAVVAGSVSGGAVFDAARREVWWKGFLAPGEVRTITYQAAPEAGLAPGTHLVNRVLIREAQDGLRLERVVPLWVDAPDLEATTLTADVSGRAQRWITYSLALRNRGVAATRAISAVVRLDATLHPLTETLRADSGRASLQNGRLTWSGPLDPGAVVTVSLVLTRPLMLRQPWVAATAVVQDGVTAPVVRHSQLYLPPYQTFVPLASSEE